MRVLAAILVLVLVAVPVLGCGGGGGPGCSGQCGYCTSAFDCCDGGAICTGLSDGTFRCTTFTPVFC